MQTIVISRRTKEHSSVSLKPRRGNSHVKGAGMLVVLLRGVNLGFWSHVECLGKTPSYVDHM